VKQAYDSIKDFDVDRLVTIPYMPRTTETLER
jgi:hypothetical protein